MIDKIYLDLPLTPASNSPMFGFGLWNYPIENIVLECTLLILFLFFYMSKTQPIDNSFGAKYGMIIFGIVLCLCAVVNYVSPPPDTKLQMGSFALILCFGLAYAGYKLEVKRQGKDGMKKTM